jgi:hypothetical protein
VNASMDCRLGDTHVTAPAAVGLKRRYLQAQHQHQQHMQAAISSWVLCADSGLLEFCSAHAQAGFSAASQAKPLPQSNLESKQSSTIQL